MIGFKMNEILLAGASGRLGQEVVAASKGRNLSIQPITRTDLSRTAELLNTRTTQKKCPSVIVDVTLPEGTELLVQSLLNTEKNEFLAAVIVGSTGHSDEQRLKIEKLSTRIPVILSTNFSRGVYLFEELLKAKTSSGVSVSELARQLGFDLSMWESHHTKKIDAPSGTARTLAQAAGVAQERIASTRVGAVVGEHSLFLSQESEELRITHTAHARKLFAEGALDLCERIFKTGLQPKLYTTSEAFSELLRTSSSVKD
jgi:4-hydroxy-tetrahydrodipicolinate reductase